MDLSLQQVQEPEREREGRKGGGIGGKGEGGEREGRNEEGDNDGVKRRMLWVTSVASCILVVYMCACVRMCLCVHVCIGMHVSVCRGEESLHSPVLTAAGCSVLRSSSLEASCPAQP